MVFNTGAALLDAIVLAVVSHETQGTYGYKITQDVRQAIDFRINTVPGASTASEGWLSGDLRHGVRREKPPLLPDYGGRDGTVESVQERVDTLFHPDFQFVCGE